MFSSVGLPWMLPARSRLDRLSLDRAFAFAAPVRVGDLGISADLPSPFPGRGFCFSSLRPGGVLGGRVGAKPPIQSSPPSPLEGKSPACLPGLSFPVAFFALAVPEEGQRLRFRRSRRCGRASGKPLLLFAFRPWRRSGLASLRLRACAFSFPGRGFCFSGMRPGGESPLAGGSGAEPSIQSSWVVPHALLFFRRLSVFWDAPFQSKATWFRDALLYRIGIGKRYIRCGRQ